MPEKWVDESITTRANRTPAQQAQDERAEELRHLDLTGRLMEGWKQHKAAIAQLEARLDTLHDLIEQQQDGARHLAGRIDRAELRTITLERAIERLGKGWRQDRQKIARLLAAVPSAGEPTMQKMCDDVEFRGPTEEDEG